MSLEAIQATHELEINNLGLELEKECDKLANIQLKLQEELKLSESFQEELNLSKVDKDKKTEMNKIRDELNEKISEVRRLQIELTRRENAETDDIADGLQRVIATVEKENNNLKCWTNEKVEYEMDMVESAGKSLRSLRALMPAKERHERTAGLEQEIESLKKKLTACTREKLNLQEELSEAYCIKGQLADLHAAEVSKNMEAEKQVKFFQGCVASAFAERDHSIMEVTYPNMMEFFESFGVDMEVSDMSFSVSLDKGHGYEWGSRTGLSSLFAQKKNALNPYFWQMIREILKFKDDVLRYLEELESNPDIDRNETLGHFITARGYSELFQKAYLVPVCASIWSCPAEGVMSFSAYSVLSFCRNHYLLQLFGRPQWLTVRWRSHDYVNKVREQLESRGCQIRTGCGVHSVSTIDDGCLITCEDGSQETYNGCIMAIHAPDALKMLGKQATYDEMRILGAFQYVYSDVFLHRDKNLMPKNPAAWSAWNFLGTMDNKVCVTYWLNVLQNLGETGLPYLVTLNPSHTPEHTLLKWSTGHPFPSVAASKASFELDHIQGKRGIWFCGAYQGYGFHEDGLKAGLVAAHGMLGKSCAVLNNPKHMVPSLIETGARLFVTRFLGQYISTGCLILLEEGGTIFTFEGTRKKCLLKVSLRVHNPQFYWKVATNADLGLADAYINGDFSVVDKNEGLQNLFMIFIANRDLKTSVSRFNNKRGWWTPLLFTACIASAKYFFQHVSRQNTVTQARRNISRHYDLSNELFALFLDETMTYSCAVFKSEDEDLKVAQLRKISLLIEKARINKEHEVLEIGCGWGSLAIEVVKRTGCKYTGITLSEEQLRFAEMKVKEAGLQDHIRFLLCDYRQLSDTYKYDRIISCEMIEAVGHEYMEGFFGCCDSVLAEDGILVLQFISIPDERYDEYRRSSDFIKEYIFPGGCLPSLSRITSAMVASSRLCVEHLENIGIHYHQTLRCWRENFLENQSKIIALGLNEKFIRTWEYYFDYCASGFKTCTLGNYQVVFSHPGNVSTFGNAYKGVPSAY